MSLFGKTALFAVVAFGSVIAVRHAERGMNASVPKDMPEDSHFLPSGFNVANNEQTGDWIACRVDAQQATDWCRVTDQRGMVVYQGDFLPLNSAAPLPGNALAVASTDPQKMWVRGPAEAGPVPVIPLQGGNVLVPAADRDALRQRWAVDSTEISRIESGE